MKINDAYTQQAATQGPARVDQNAPASRPVRPAEASSIADKGALSELSSLVARALETPAPDRSEKVEALRQMYQSGAYDPDVSKLTDALIDASLK